jgi:hypothetical protein
MSSMRVGEILAQEISGTLHFSICERERTRELSIAVAPGSGSAIPG